VIYRINEIRTESVINGAIALDTNVLLWFFYDNIVYTTGYQRQYYPPFIEALIENGSVLYTSVYNIFEFFNVVEETEYRIYLSSNGMNEKDCSKKKYRKLEVEREKLKIKLKLLYAQIHSIVRILEYSINDGDISLYVEYYDNHRYDTFDYCLVKSCLKEGIRSIVTDDSDFYNGAYELENINIVTANKNLK